MNPAPDPVTELRGLSTTELVQLGENSLRERILDQAVFAHRKHSPISAANIEEFLADPDCLRHPTRLQFEFGEMAMHQFAQPDIDHRNLEQDGRVLFLRPMLRERPDLLVPAVVYMVPLINYGEIISDELCLLYGATLLGLMEQEFYGMICALADAVGAELCFGTSATPTLTPDPRR